MIKESILHNSPDLSAAIADNLLFSLIMSSSSLFLFGYLLQPLQDPEKMTQIIVEALESTGQRGIINKGWGGLGNCKSGILALMLHSIKPAISVNSASIQLSQLQDWKICT